MKQTAYAVREIWQKDERTLGIGWTDGREDSFDVVMLRKECPCAACVDEMSGQRKQELLNVPDSVRPIRINSVGRYALSVEFSDQHRTGIYSFAYLRKLAESPAPDSSLH